MSTIIDCTYVMDVVFYSNLLAHIIQGVYNKLYLLCSAAPVSNSPARIIQGPRSKLEVLQGSNLTLECVVQGSPVPVVTWDKYGGQLPEGRYIQSLGK